MINETSKRLQRLSHVIMDVWEERTLKEVKAANLQETLALRNSIPIYLSQLVDALSNTINRTEARVSSDKSDSTRIGKKHGMERAISSGYTMDQMILEYHILRQVICDVLEKEAILTPVEREVIVCSIEQAVNDAATQFSETLRDYQDQISHTLAHDLRNPLTTVKVSAQVLTRQFSDDKGQLDRLQRIIKSVDRIDGMIQELLDQSRIKAGKDQAFEFKECDFDWLVKDIAFELNISHKDRFQVVSSGKCMGFWNENRLRRVIENLATNAVKYGQEDSSVTLSIDQTESEAILKVHNLGNPISKEDQSRLFQKFQRAKSAESKVGWGIGLTVVKSMVEGHKGTIEVESAEGKGTTFMIRLPKDPASLSR